MKGVIVQVLLAAVSGAAAAAAAAPITPGLQPDGSTLLHSQWPIRPVGIQVPLGEFPINAVVDPTSRYAAVLHAGWGPHQIWVVDLQTNTVVSVTPVHEVFSGIAFSADGRRLVCGGGSDGVLWVYDFDRGHLSGAAQVKLPTSEAHAVVGGLALAADGRTAYATTVYFGKIMRVDLTTGAIAWTTSIDPPETAVNSAPVVSREGEAAPNDYPVPLQLNEASDPFGLALDARHHRLYASLWGKADVAVLNADDGRLLARWPAGLHPNEVLLSRDGKRLFVSNGGLNSVTVLDTASGQASETLRSSFSASDPPGSTPDSLSLSPDGNTLFVANAYNNNVAVFDVSRRGHGQALGFVPAGWFPFAARVTPDGRHLVIVSARGLTPAANYRVPGPGEPPPGRKIDLLASPAGPEQQFVYDGTLYRGSLAIIALPGKRDFADALKKWTTIAETCRPAPPPPPLPGNPIPVRGGAPSPIRYVIYVIKENRTYDQVFGDMPEGHGDPALCLFPEIVTPNLHQLARSFVLLDNFYANAEISASGHEWSMGAYSSEFVERNWPIDYGHKQGKAPYGGEGGYAAAVPALGYLWDRAKAAGVTYRSYGEFVHGAATPADPSISNLPALRGHADPLYRGWALTYSDLARVPRFIAELHRFEAAGDLPRLQIVRLPNDHTEAARAGALTPRAMVAQNDLAVGQLIDAVSHSKFWPQTAVFIVEDDAQNGPDHVDAHRTEALVVSPYTRRHAVDSTAYTTCSMLATIEAILGMEPMSQFDAAANPMRASFQAEADLAGYTAVPSRVPLNEHNPARTRGAAISAHFNFSHEDAIDDQAFNHVIWAAVRGEQSVMPAPVHAAFVRSLPAADDDDDDDDG
jgi:DNA-binding beta-propeller fold protein YncE/phospholipase C